VNDLEGFFEKYKVFIIGIIILIIVIILGLYLTGGIIPPI
jgi:hypothetical protein